MTEIQLNYSDEWAPIPGWEGLYSATRTGLIRSDHRVIMRSNGQPQTVRERIRKPQMGTDGYPTVRLYRDGKGENVGVHQAVMYTFGGSPPPGMEVRHKDDDPLNPQFDNLEYGTRRDNNLDAVARGRNANTRKTHCKRGHLLSGDNIYPHPTRRACKICARDRSREFARSRK